MKASLTAIAVVLGLSSWAGTASAAPQLPEGFQLAQYHCGPRCQEDRAIARERARRWRYRHEGYEHRPLPTPPRYYRHY